MNPAPSAFTFTFLKIQNTSEPPATAPVTVCGFCLENPAYCVSRQFRIHQLQLTAEWLLAQTGHIMEINMRGRTQTAADCSKEYTMKLLAM